MCMIELERGMLELGLKSTQRWHTPCGVALLETIAIEDLIEVQGRYDALHFGLGSEFSSAATGRVDVLLEIS